MVKSSSLVAAAILLASTVAASAAPSLSYSYQSPAENVARSQQYDHLLEVSSSFRHYRMHKECGPVTFTGALRSDCLQSFDTYEPFQGY